MEFVEITKGNTRTSSEIRVSLYKKDDYMYNRFFFSREILQKIHVDCGERLRISYSADKTMLIFSKCNNDTGFKITSYGKHYAVINVKKFIEMERGTKHIDHFEVDEVDSCILVYL